MVRYAVNYSLYRVTPDTGGTPLGVRATIARRQRKIPVFIGVSAGTRRLRPRFHPRRTGAHGRGRCHRGGAPAGCLYDVAPYESAWLAGQAVLGSTAPIANSPITARKQYRDASDRPLRADDLDQFGDHHHRILIVRGEFDRQEF